MQNPRLVDLANSSIKLIIRRLTGEASSIFGEFNDEDYQNLVAVFARLRRDVGSLSEENIEDLREFIDFGIGAIARRYERGEPIHPGTMNILMMAIQVFNQADGHPYQFGVEFIENITPTTQEFMVEVVQPMTQNLQLLALHHAPWVNPEHAAREAARRAWEEAPGAETHIARTLAEFRAMGGHTMESECPLCMEEFIERPTNGRPPVFIPVVFHKGDKDNWFHPMHTSCTYRLQKDECPICRVKVIFPKMMLSRKPRRPSSDPTHARSVRRTPRRWPRSPSRSPMGRSVKRSPAKRSPTRRSVKRSVKQRSADF